MYGRRQYVPYTGPRYSKFGSYSRYRPAVSAAARYNAGKKYQSKAPSSKGSIYQQLKSLQKVVRTQRPEQKFADVTLTASNIDNAAGTVIHLTQIAQGDTGLTRSGEFIILTGIHIKGIWVREATALSAQGHVMCCIVQDTQTVDGATPVGTDIMSSGDPTVAFPNVIAQAERFKFLYVSPVLSTPMMDLGGTAEGVVPTRDAYLEYKWSGNIRVGYSGAATTDISKNGVFIAFYSNDGGDFTDFSGVARISYTDA